jgi:hypothetical protein
LEGASARSRLHIDSPFQTVHDGGDLESFSDGMT